MPTGPEGQKRPADVIGNAIRVAQIATGEAVLPRNEKCARSSIPLFWLTLGREAPLTRFSLRSDARDLHSN